MALLYGFRNVNIAGYQSHFWTKCKLRYITSFVCFSFASAEILNGCEFDFLLKFQQMNYCINIHTLCIIIHQSFFLTKSICNSYPIASRNFFKSVSATLELLKRFCRICGDNSHLFATSCIVKFSSITIFLNSFFNCSLSEKINIFSHPF